MVPWDRTEPPGVALALLSAEVLESSTKLWEFKTEPRIHRPTELFQSWTMSEESAGIILMVSL